MIDTELHALPVDPDAGRDGHGSRLLAATVDMLRGDDGCKAFWSPPGGRRVAPSAMPSSPATADRWPASCGCTDMDEEGW
jgi:hypothetical protein